MRDLFIIDATHPIAGPLRGLTCCELRDAAHGYKYNYSVGWPQIYDPSSTIDARSDAMTRACVQDTGRGRGGESMDIAWVFNPDAILDDDDDDDDSGETGDRDGMDGELECQMQDVSWDDHASAWTGDDGSESTRVWMDDVARILRTVQGAAFLEGCMHTAPRSVEASSVSDRPHALGPRQAPQARSWKQTATASACSSKRWLSKTRAHRCS